jgi:hypothetical protein
VAADTELRRNPQMRIEPLRSAEPEQVTDEQRAELNMLPEEQLGYQPPAWVRELAEARTAFSEKIAERQSVTAQDELEQQQQTGLFITVSRRAHMILCSAAHSLTIYCTDGNVAEVGPEEREMVRASFEARLNADWPSYITHALASAQPAA